MTELYITGLCIALPILTYICLRWFDFPIPKLRTYVVIVLLSIIWPVTLLAAIAVGILCIGVRAWDEEGE